MKQFIRILSVLVSTLLLVLTLSISVLADDTRTVYSLPELMTQLAAVKEQADFTWSETALPVEEATLTVPEGAEVTLHGGEFQTLIVNGAGTLTLDGVIIHGKPGQPALTVQQGAVRLVGDTIIEGADATKDDPISQPAITVSDGAILSVEQANTLRGGSDRNQTKGKPAIIMDKDTVLYLQEVATLSAGSTSENSPVIVLDQTAQAVFADDMGEQLHAIPNAVQVQTDNSLVTQELYRATVETVDFAKAHASFALGPFSYQTNALWTISGWTLTLNAKSTDKGSDVVFRGWMTDHDVRVSDDTTCTVFTSAQDTVYTADFTYLCGCTLTLTGKDCAVVMPYYEDSATVPLTNLVESITRTGTCRLHKDEAEPELTFTVDAIHLNASDLPQDDFGNYFELDGDSLLLHHVRSEYYTLDLTITAAMEDGASASDTATITVTLGPPNDTILPQNQLEYDLSTQKDLAIHPNWNGNTLTGVVGYHDAANEQIVVSPDVGYYLSEDGSTIYLSADLFSQLKSGDDVRFVFSFSAGGDQQLVVHLTQSYSSFFGLPKGKKSATLVILLLCTGALAFFLRRKFS